MTTRATASRQWTPEALAALPVESGFRLRGLEVTRLDTFIDAAFAFVLTLLVISFDELPETYEQMIGAIKRITAFGVSFVMLMLFWVQHRAFSRRFGLETPRTLMLSLMLIFTVLVYVFPLRTVIAGMFAQLSGGYLPADFVVRDFDELRGLFLFYSSGFLPMSVLVWLLVGEALRAGDRLLLDAGERLRCGSERFVWASCGVAATLSIIFALTLPDGYVPLAGYIYWGLSASIPLVLSRRRRALRALEVEAGTAPRA